MSNTILGTRDTAAKARVPALVKSIVYVDTKFICACFCFGEFLKENTVSSLFKLCRVILEVQIFMIVKIV